MIISGTPLNWTIQEIALSFSMGDMVEVIDGELKNLQGKVRH